MIPNLLGSTVFAIALAASFSFAVEKKGESALPEPVLSYAFDGEKETGPREPHYRGQDPENTSRRFGKANDALIVESSDAVVFNAGDSITMEAYVRVSSIGTGHMPYLIGKGRHDNGVDQNFAMRLKSDESGIHLGFLFSSRASQNLSLIHI